MSRCLTYQPVIKWTGSKRSQAAEIVSRFPKHMDTYLEPFVGGGSVLAEVLRSDIKVKRYVASDTNLDLIKLWQTIKSQPDLLSIIYMGLWEEMSRQGTVDEKKAFFNQVRRGFNEDRHPAHFLFLTRTSVNGLIRYNSRGDFNASLHIGRDGIQPERLSKIIHAWSKILVDNDVRFVHSCYSSLTSGSDDFIYLDPPYANTKGQYYGGLDLDSFWEWMRKQDGRYILSFNGTSGEDDNVYGVPKDVYSLHELIKSGKSSFKRLKNAGDNMVYESLYIK